MRRGLRSWVGRNSPVLTPFAVGVVSAALTQCGFRPQSTDTRLVNRFGPQAKVVVREVFVAQQHRSGGAADDQPMMTTEDASSAAPAVRQFRASVTFRQLGFPVEVSSVTAETADAAETQAVEMAMSSNIFFIKPQPNRDQNTRGVNTLQQERLAPQAQEIKRTIEALRHVAQAHGRVLKFAIRRTGDAGAEASTSAPPLSTASLPGGEKKGQWTCRAYVRDDWSAHSKAILATEQRGGTPNDALVTTFRCLAEEYQAELESPNVEMEDVLEINRLLGLENRESKLKCLATASEQSLGGAGAGFTGSVTVMDEYENSYTLLCKNTTSKQLAYRNLAQQVQERENVCRDDVLSSAFLQPLIVKLRWQLEGLADEVARMLSTPEGKLKYSVGGLVRGTKNTLEALQISHTVFVTPEDAAVPATADHQTYKCSIAFDGVEIASAEGKGSYRVDFDCHSNALYYLLDKYGEVAERLHYYLFPSAELLERSVRHHDSFKILQHHRGKWNCYAVLGTILNNLIGSFYNTQYRELDAFGNKFSATLVYNDGLQFERQLISRSSTLRGEAWRLACMDAIKENFPVQYNAAREMEDFDLSGDTTARGSKFKSLPREKRIQHMNNLQSVVLAFAEEDYGWTNIDFKIRGAPGGLSVRWVAELEANVHGERERRVVYSSPAHQQAKQAKRLLLYLVAKKYFPKELRAYSRLGRSDALNPDEVERQGIASIYQGHLPFVTQVLELLNRYKPDQRPITYKVERHYGPNAVRLDNDGSTEDLVSYFNPRFKATLFGRDGQAIICERLGDEKEGPLAVLRSVLLQACKSYVTSDDSKKLFEEYDQCVPSNVASTKDLALYLFCTFLGGDAAEDDPHPCVTFDVVYFENREWVVTAILPALGQLAISRVTALTKKEALRQALVVAARQNFQSMLRKFSKNSIEVQAFSDDILQEEISDRPPQSSTAVSSCFSGDSSPASPLNYHLMPPTVLLKACMDRDDPDFTVRHEQQTNPGCGFTCRVFRVKKPEASFAATKVDKSETGRPSLAPPPLPPALRKPQEIGRGTALTKAQALHLAAVAALENLFEEDLRRAMALNASYCDMPPAG
jgi:hypothetical protein